MHDTNTAAKMDKNNRTPLHDKLEEQQQDPSDDEKPSKMSREPGLFSRARIFGPVKQERGDLALLACCLVTGLVDAASFSNWGVFVGMQTGMLYI